jgi:ribonucleoside-diphosphate reductase alpha chain
MPNSANYDDVKGAYMVSWKNGLKSVSLYRDGSKLSQPLNAFAPGKDPLADTILKVEKGLELSPVTSDRRKSANIRGLRKNLPSRRMGYTQKAKIGGHSIFLRTGEYEDGGLGEIFLDMHKEGAGFRSLLNSFAITVSLGLQYGVPLDEYVEAFTFSRFEPNGMVQGHDYVKMATSVIDYIFRDLAISYLKRSDLGQVKSEDLVATATNSEMDLTNPKAREKQSSGLRQNASPVAGKTKQSGNPEGNHRSMNMQFEGQTGSVTKAIGQSAPALAYPQEQSQVMVLEQNPQENEAAKIFEARCKGYEGDACSLCGSFTLLRNGTCMKCDNCGSTTGCS